MGEYFKFSLSELITLLSVVVSIATSYTMLKSSVDELKKDVAEVRLEQYRINAVLNFVYGESVRTGWKMSKTQSEQIRKEIEELRKLYGLEPTAPTKE